MEQGDVVIKKQWFIGSRTGGIDQYYSFDSKKLIGQGSYGSVTKGIVKGSNVKRAIKIIPKSKVKNQDRFKNEIEIMKTLDHPNIIKLYETFEDNRNVYLVMELCEGGELFDAIIEAGHFDENKARQIFKQIMEALNYCHNIGICHRDLKPENFLLTTKTDNAVIKVIDFGLSSYFGDKNTLNINSGDDKMHTKAGTPYYISPEVLKGDYDQSCDIWSAGVILYILLSGVPPFYGNTDPEILEAVKKGEYSFDIEEFQHVSSGAKDLISKMLTKPKQRLNAQQCLEHPWMKSNSNEQKLKLNFTALRNFQNHGKLKKTALTYIASQCNDTEISELGKLFKSLDKDGNGILSLEEIRAGLANFKDSQMKELIAVINSIDTDLNQTISYTEFIAATLERNTYLKEEKLYQAFKMFDADGSGKITAQELKNVLGQGDFADKPMSYWENMIKEADQNGDGEIDYNEFIQMMQQK